MMGKTLFSGRGLLLLFSVAASGAPFEKCALERYVDSATWRRLGGVVNLVSTRTGEKLCFDETSPFSLALKENCEPLSIVSDSKDGGFRFVSSQRTFLLSTTSDGKKWALSYEDEGRWFLGHDGNGTVVKTGLRSEVWSLLDVLRPETLPLVSRRIFFDHEEKCKRSPLKMRFGDDVQFRDMDEALSFLNLSSKLPSTIVLGAGHSGTSTVAHHLVKRGWVRPTLRSLRAKLENSLGEDVRVVDKNRHFVTATNVDKKPALEKSEIRNVAASLLQRGDCWLKAENLKSLWRKNPKPAMWKDPQFVWLLHLWVPVFEKADDLALIHVRRDPGHIVSSHIRRGETSFKHLNATLEEAVKARILWADFQFEHWCGPAVSFNIGSLQHAKVMNHFADKTPPRPPPKIKKRRVPPSPPKNQRQQQFLKKIRAQQQQTSQRRQQEEGPRPTPPPMDI